MRARIGRGRAAIASLAILAFASGCGDADTASGASDDEVEAWLKKSPTDAMLESPVAKAIGADDTGALAATAREQGKKQQQQVAECMREQGFEYIPYDAGSMVDLGSEEFDPYGGLDRKAYAAKWGYGIATVYDSKGEMLDDAPGNLSDSGDAEGDAAVDPNQKIVEAMSPDEQAAYQKALYGDMMSAVGDGSDSGQSDSGSEVDGTIPVDGSGEGEMPDFSKMGCTGSSFDDTFGGAFDEGAMEELDKAQQELTKRVEADKRVKAAAREFRACMKEAGYPEVTRPADDFVLSGSEQNPSGKSGRDIIQERLDNDVFGFDGVGGGPGVTALEGDASEVGGSEVGGDTPSGDDDSGGFEQQVDAKELAKLKKDELALANAELPCLGRYEIAYTSVRFEAEERFLKEHPEMVASMKKVFGG